MDPRVLRTVKVSELEAQGPRESTWNLILSCGHHTVVKHPGTTPPTRVRCGSCLTSYCEPCRDVHVHRDVAGVGLVCDACGYVLQPDPDYDEAFGDDDER